MCDWVDKVLRYADGIGVGVLVRLGVRVKTVIRGVDGKIVVLYRFKKRSGGGKMFGTRLEICWETKFEAKDESDTHGKIEKGKYMLMDMLVIQN